MAEKETPEYEAPTLEVVGSVADLTQTGQDALLTSPTG